MSYEAPVIFLEVYPFLEVTDKMYSSKMREKTQKEENMNPRTWKRSPWPWAIKEPGYLWGQSSVAASPLFRATALVVLLLFCPTQVRRIITNVPYETVFGVVSHSHLDSQCSLWSCCPLVPCFRRLRSWSLWKPVTQALFLGIICG